MEISRGNEDQMNKNKGKGGFITLPFIIGSSIGFNLAAGSWHGNLTMFLTQYYNINNDDATRIYNIMNVGVYFFSFIGALLSDSLFGSFFVINTASLASLLGIIMLCLSTMLPSLRPNPCNTNTICNHTTTNYQYAFLLIALSLATFGFGCTRFNLSSLGAFQFDKLKHRRYLFNAYIWAYAAGWAINYSVLGFVVQDKGRWKVSFGIGIVGNAIGIILFLVGSRYFRHILPHTNPFLWKLKSLVTRLIRRPKARNSVHDADDALSDSEMDHTTHPGTISRSTSQVSSKDDNHNNLSKFEDKDEEIRKVIKLLPASSAGVILNTAVATSSSLIVYQASYMDLTIGSHIKLPAEVTTVFTLVFTAITVAIFDILFFPLWKKVVGVSMKPMQRGGTGQMITVFGMIGLAAVEMARLESLNKGHHIMSVLWLLFPLALIGIGAGWYIPGGLTIHFQEFPDSLKCTSTAISSLPIGIGLYLSKAHISVVKDGTSWLPNDINSGTLDRFYWILATIIGVNFGYYLICAVYYRYYNWPDPNDPDSHDHMT